MRRMVLSVAVVICLLGLGYASAQSDTTNASKPLDWANTVVRATPDPVDNQKIALREKRGSSFDDTTHTKKQVDAEDSEGTLSGHGMSVYRVRTDALPVASSDVVVVGQVAGFQPFLSKDRTAIYTELYVRVERVFKGSDALNGATIVIPRRGGTLQLKTGRVVKGFAPQSEKSIELGTRYVLFLAYDQERDWFGVVKLWELQDGRVIPVSQDDMQDARAGRSKYSGMDETEFLEQLRLLVQGR